MSMFCYQCEQTAKGAGCGMKRGVCGKSADVAALQDNLIQGLKAVSAYAGFARQKGESDPEIDAFIPYGMFATLTNTNFDAAAFEKLIEKAGKMRSMAEKLAGKPSAVPAYAREWEPAEGLDSLIRQGREYGIKAKREKYGKAAAGLQETIIYGLKGAGAYIHHAKTLGYENDKVFAAFNQILDFVASEPASTEKLFDFVLKTGELNMAAMELLDNANTGTFGHPEPTEVNTAHRKGKAILVSGHDLLDLRVLLEDTKDKDISVYTHGEMLPANAYPGLKKYPHLAGNYGGAWQDQQKEFSEFPGAILMTTNCIMKPDESYKDRIFTSGPAGWPGVRHLANGDFSPVVETALTRPGFNETEPEKTIKTGFARNSVSEAVGAVVDAVKSGAIRHFFLIGGCDGAKPGRNYYTRLAELVPGNCVILTLACGKYRFNKMDFGDIGGIPRLLDVGQCNDAYSAVKIASALADALGTETDRLPLSLVLSWFEQKAVAILLTLLHAGMKDIRLGPSFPAFTEPEVLDILSEKFGLKPVTTPEEDLKAMLG